MLSIPILALLIAIAIGGEVFLLVGKDSLSARNRRLSLEAKLKEVQLDIQIAQAAYKAARQSLNTAFDELEKSRVEAEDLNAAAVAQKQIDPVLVHTIGMPSKGMTCFRSELSKTLDGTAVEAQIAIWSRANYVDVWTSDPETAMAMARRQFPLEQGYEIGIFSGHTPAYVGGGGQG